MPASTLSRNTLGPLHRQVFAQLQVAAEREAWVADSVAAKLGMMAARAVDAARVAHPLDLHGRLEDLVRDGDPHAVLSRLVAAAHQREGAVYGALIALEGDEAEVYLRLAAWDHGVEVGRRVATSQRTEVGGPSAVFDLIGETFLESMPCRSSAVLTSESAEKVTWKHDACPFAADWARTAVPQGSACNVVSAWLRGFAAGVDGTVEYRRPAAVAHGAERCEHELVVIG